MKKAFITGITGQDGSYLAELLLAKGYDVYGLVRRSSSFNTGRIDHLYKDRHEQGVKLRLVYGDLSDASSLNRAIRDIKPDEIYNLGAQSHVRVSFDIPEYSGDVTGLGTIRLLEAIRESGITCRFYQASSSELYGKVLETPQKETTPFWPRSPYACAKAYAFYVTVNYREAYGMYASNGILFNHESPRRGETFVTRKVTRAVAHIKHGIQDKLFMGNLDAKRDWGFAGDFVEGMWLMLQQEKPDDYVLATGETHSVRELLDQAFARVDLDWKKYVEIDPAYFRPAEVDLLLGDASKAKKALGWQPKVGFKELVNMMVDADLELVRQKIHGTGVQRPKWFLERLTAAEWVRAVAMELSSYAKLFVAGHRGLVGSAICRELETRGFKNTLLQTHHELDLTNQASVLSFFEKERPDGVILAAAKVGGIAANSSYPAEFIYENIAIASNVINAAKVCQVRKLLNLGSSCIYPRLAAQPISESSLLTGELESTNRAYAVAKIAAIELCDAYRKQYGCDFISAMPTNLYGPRDNFDLEKSHVLPAMIRKFHEAKVRGQASVSLWGTGTVRREFMYVDDMARAAVHLFEHYSEAGPINVGTGTDVTVAEAAETVRKVTGFPGSVSWDTSKPDGTPRKLLSVSRLAATGFAPRVNLEQGIELTYAWFLENLHSIRE